jgi:predicted transposase YbfD/YdcC
MKEISRLSIIRHFEGLSDPRILKKTDHRLIDIVVIAICAVICGADKWTQVEAFGNARHEWLKQFLELPNGIPSHDTFGRVFAVISPNKFQDCFRSWIQEVFSVTSGEIIAVDGKTLRRSFSKRDNKAALHMVHAWATANGVLLGQQATEAKSNEITAIPQLLEMLALKGCIVTIDAMGCQSKIAKTIIDSDGDYVLAVKGNQGKLYEELQDAFQLAKSADFKEMEYDWNQSIDGGHGRVETRTCHVLSAKHLYPKQAKWKNLRSIILLENEFVNKNTGECTKEYRYYISSLVIDAALISKAIRQHWAVENNLHWCLDVIFREDECRSRIGDSAENFSLLRRIALMLLRNEKSFKGGLQTKRLQAGWNNDYLLKVLLA